MSTTKDAREFGEHIRHGGWRLGMLVARNVRPGGQNVHIPQSQNADKVSAARFAKVAGVSDTKVMRHYDAWERAADDGHVPHAADLTPESEVTLPDADATPWSNYYSAVTGGRLGYSAPDAARMLRRLGVETFLGALTDDERLSLHVATQPEHMPAPPKPPRRETTLDLVDRLVDARHAIRAFVRALNEHDGRLSMDARETVEHALNDIDTAVGWARTLIADNAPITDEALHAWLSESQP